MSEKMQLNEREQKSLVYGLPPKHSKFLFARFLSTVHAVVCTLFFLKYFSFFRLADASTQYECRENWFPVYAMTSVFVAYLTVDSFLPGMTSVYVFHHLLYGVTSLAQLAYGRR